MIITLYNVNERDKDSYLSKLKEIEKTANFVSNREGNRPKIRIETTDNDISSDEIVEKLENLGFYIFNKENIAFNFRTGGHIGTIELTLGKNLLIVGNGFDIGHGLKTKYSNFLDNINILNEILLCASSDHSINPTIQYNDKNIAEAFNNTFDIIFNSLDKDLDDKFALQDFCTEFAKKKNTSNYPTGKTRRNVASNVNAFKRKYIITIFFKKI